MSQTAEMFASPVLMTPKLDVDDALARYWLAQVILRLRREMCWNWYLRTEQIRSSGIPPIADTAAENLELTRFDAEKRTFFTVDATAKHLTEQINTAQIPHSDSCIPGSWAWVQKTLELDTTEQFILALTLAAQADGSIGPVISACMNDSSRPFPSLALAQRLWDEPEQVIGCANPTHVLYRSGLLQLDDAAGGAVAWQWPLEMHSFVASSLLNPNGVIPDVFHASARPAERKSEEIRTYLPLLKSRKVLAMQVVPLIGLSDSEYTRWASSISQAVDSKAVQIADNFSFNPHIMRAIATLAWMRGLDVILPPDWDIEKSSADCEQWVMAIQSIPVRWYVPATDAKCLSCFSPSARLPAFQVPLLSFDDRRARFVQALGSNAPGMEKTIDECARRFRFQDMTLDRLELTIRQLNGAIDSDQLIALCRVEAVSQLGDLAQSVQPRFEIDDLVLPPSEQRQFAEVVTAMNSLTEVHYQWGTAKVWNESGLTVLFYGPPGTGKTMAAEALSQTLNLPMYRIDLSQVVNKYIGETEKNLKKIFDGAEMSDCILFFDEADALFGKRTEVKDAHDRFANIEISYLLERMERFKGLAILATNRKKDLDEAFMRRLRYVVNFPLPGRSEREKIWRQVFPECVDTSSLNLPYLARQFPLSGGHIRSIAFNACLQSAGREQIKNSDYVGRVDMEAVLIAVKRELDKLERSTNTELFGEYAAIIQSLNDA